MPPVHKRTRRSNQQRDRNRNLWAVGDSLNREWTTPTGILPMRAVDAPAGIAGLSAWWDLSQETYANNDDVPTVTDRTGHGFHLTGPGGAADPTFKTGQFPSGLPGVEFNGTFEYLESPDTGNFLSTTGKTIFTVFIPLAIGTAGGDVGTSDQVWQEGAGNLGLALEPTETLKPHNWDGAAYDQTSHTGCTIGDAHIAMVRHDGTTLYSSLDLGAEDSVASGTTGGGGNNPLYVGAGYTGTTWANVVVGEIICYDRALTATEVADVLAWLDAKWLTPVADEVTGTAAGTWGAWSGTATGTRTVTGTASRAWGGWTGTSTATRTVSGTAARAWGGWTATATGTRTTSATATGTWGGWTGASSGTRTTSGTASGTWGAWTGSVCLVAAQVDLP